MIVAGFYDVDGEGRKNPMEHVTFFTERLQMFGREITDVAYKTRTRNIRVVDGDQKMMAELSLKRAFEASGIFDSATELEDPRYELPTQEGRTILEICARYVDGADNRKRNHALSSSEVNLFGQDRAKNLYGQDYRNTSTGQGLSELFSGKYAPYEQYIPKHLNAYELFKAADLLSTVVKIIKNSPELLDRMNTLNAKTVEFLEASDRVVSISRQPQRPGNYIWNGPILPRYDEAERYVSNPDDYKLLDNLIDTDNVSDYRNFLQNPTPRSWYLGDQENLNRLIANTKAYRQLRKNPSNPDVYYNQVHRDDVSAVRNLVSQDNPNFDEVFVEEAESQPRLNKNKRRAETTLQSSFAKRFASDENGIYNLLKNQPLCRSFFEFLLDNDIPFPISFLLLNLLLKEQLH